MRLAGRLQATENRLPWALFLCLGVVLVAVTPPPSSNPFGGPMIVAERLLRGEPDLPANLGWMEGFTHEGRRFLAYPPMVSFILVPYAALGGGFLGQTAANSLLIFGAAILLYALLRSTAGMEQLASAGALAWVLGTQFLYSAHVGDVWLLMHSEGAFFLLLALYLAVARASFFWAGVAFMIASLTRYAILFSAPAFVLIALRSQGGSANLPGVARALARFALGACIPTAIVLLYNWTVFDDPLKNSYTSTWHQKGGKTPQIRSFARRAGLTAFDLDNLWRNLRFYATARPAFVRWPPYVRFTGGGESIWLLSPFLVGVLFANLRIPIVRHLLVGTLTMFVFYLLYSYQGYIQFGSRYLTDLFPLLVPVALSAFTRPAPIWRRLLIVLIAASIVINAASTWLVSVHGLRPPKTWPAPRAKTFKGQQQPRPKLVAPRPARPRSPQ